MRFSATFSILIVSLLLPLGLPAQGNTTAANGTVDPISEAFSHFAELLERHLIEQDLENNGLVSAFDYRAALQHGDTMELLNRQREMLAGFDLGLIDSREKGNAFWLNAYNFFMVAHLLQERPGGELVDSVWDYGGRYNPFQDNVFERELFVVDGGLYSLDQMEKGILLGVAYRDKGWAEARVHFAVNCAAVGCPPLRSKLYTPDNVDDLLTENTRRAFNTPRQLRVEGDTLYLSRLFDWYKEDFEREQGSVRGFIREYAADRVIEKMEGTGQIDFIDYDWSLNSPENFPEID